MRSTGKPVSVVIADDHELMRDGLRMLLCKDGNLIIKGCAANGQELLTLVERHHPDIVLTDIVMPLMDGIEATRQIRASGVPAKVIALSMFDTPAMIVDMVRAGASGYLLKNVNKAEIFDAVYAVNEGDEYYCREISRQLAHYVASGQKEKVPLNLFDEKELNVIRCICREFTTQEIGRELFLSKRTVDGYRARLLTKMNVRGIAGMVLYAIRHGLYELPEEDIVV